MVVVAVTVVSSPPLAVCRWRAQGAPTAWEVVVVVVGGCTRVHRKAQGEAVALKKVQWWMGGR